MGAACFCIDAVIDAFGPDRLIWGSDWPVVTLATSYNAWLNLARHSIPMNHHAAIFSDNAARIYRLRMPT
jgi:L-fuconolactonase